MAEGQRETPQIFMERKNLHIEKAASLPLTVSSLRSPAPGQKHVGGSSPVGPLASSLLIGFNIIFDFK